MTAEYKNDLILKLETDKPSEMAQKKAAVELRETPDRIETGLKELRALLEAEKDFITPITNDNWLLMFLRTCKFYPESARDLIKRFYNIRKKYSEVPKLLLPNKLKHVFDAGIVSILPQRDQHGRRMVVTLAGRPYNYKVISPDELFSDSTICLDLLQKEPETQINGIVYIVDLEGFSFGHCLRTTPYNLKRIVEFVQDHSPIRVKGFHIVNQPKLFVPFFAGIKPFFSTKFAKRTIMHGTDFKSLHEYISPECLPACYGGTLQSKLMYSRETYQLLADHEQLFDDLQNYGPKKIV